MSSDVKNPQSNIPLWKIVLAPLDGIGKGKTVFFIWFIFTIIAGQIGLFIDFAIGLNTSTVSIWDFISEFFWKNSKVGNFYVIGIAICASMLANIFTEIVSDDKIKFRIHKVFILIISLFTLFFMGIYYSVLTGAHGEIHQAVSRKLVTSIDYPQSLLYFLAIGISVYIFAIGRLGEFYKDYSYLDPPFYKEDDKNVEELGKAASKSKVDPKGIAI